MKGAHRSSRRSVTDAGVTPVAADISTAEGQAALLEACPEPDILINNNGGPPFKDFRELDREAMMGGVTMNMIGQLPRPARVDGVGDGEDR